MAVQFSLAPIFEPQNKILSFLKDYLYIEIKQGVFENDRYL